MIETINKLNRISRQMQQEMGRDPTPEELAQRMEMPEEKVRKVQKIAKQPISLETPLSEDEDSHLGDFIEDQNATSPMDVATTRGLEETMRDVLATLGAREAKVLRMRFGIDMNTDHTLEEVGKQFDVTPRAHPPDRSQGAAQAAPSLARRAPAQLHPGRIAPRQLKRAAAPFPAGASRSGSVGKGAAAREGL